MNVRPDDMPPDGRGRPSLHDPEAQLPDAMWDQARPKSRTSVRCRMCTAASPARDSAMLEVSRPWRTPFPVAQALAAHREQGPLALICEHCDKVG